MKKAKPLSGDRLRELGPVVIIEDCTLDV